VRRALRALSTVLIVAGALVLADAGLTLVWQEPLSSLWTAHKQHVLRGELRAMGRAAPSPVDQRALDRLSTNTARIAYLAEKLRRRTDHGQAVGRIQIPRIGSDFVVVKGSDPADLRRGPGLYDGSPFPGSHGTVAVAGHRTTYLAPFRHVDDLSPGDRIVVDMPYARFTYRIDGTRIVKPDAVSVIRRVRYDQLVLTACEPLFSAAKRIVVFARLIKVRPEGILGRYG
jgi:sortase A